MTQSDIKRQIMEVRPSLKQIAPLTYTNCWIFVVINFILGLGMFFLYRTNIDLAVANIFSYQVWGVLFFSAGILSAISLLRNEHTTTKQLLMIGLCLKAIWAVALIIRCITAPQTILITAVWFGLFAFQAATYIYFLPKTPTDTGEVTQ